MDLIRSATIYIYAEMSGPEMTRAEKKLRRLFNENGLKITTLVGSIETDFLDVVLNLAVRSFRPFRKPGDEPTYINVESNHPPNIINIILDISLHKLDINFVTSLDSYFWSLK